MLGARRTYDESTVEKPDLAIFRAQFCQLASLNGITIRLKRVLNLTQTGLSLATNT